MNNKGLSLIEVMVSLAIMSIILLGTTQQMYMTTLQAQTTDVKISSAALNSSISQLALNEAACTAALTKTPQILGADIVFSLPDGRNIVVGASFPEYNVKVRTLKYDGITLINTYSDGSKSYFGNLVMAVSSLKTVVGPKDFAPRSLGMLTITANSAGYITQCGVIASTAPPVTPPVVPPVTPPATPGNSNGSNCSNNGVMNSDGTCAHGH